MVCVKPDVEADGHIVFALGADGAQGLVGKQAHDHSKRFASGPQQAPTYSRGGLRLPSDGLGVHCIRIWATTLCYVFDAHLVAGSKRRQMGLAKNSNRV